MKFKVNLEDYIKKVTGEDGVIDYSKGNELVEDDVLKFNSKNSPDMETLKKEAYDLAQDDFIKGLKIEGVETVDTFKTHLSKLGAEDKAQEVIRLNQINNELQSKYDTLDSEYSKVTKESTVFKNEKFLSDKKPNVELDYLTFKIDKLDGDTFEDKYNAFVANDDNKKFFEPVAPINQGDSGTKRKTEIKDDVKAGFEKVLEERGLL